MNSDNLSKIKDVGKNIATKYGLQLLILFGSQATGKVHKDSDIDIGFISNHHYGPLEKARIQLDYEQSTGLGPIELVDLKLMPPLLQRYVSLEGVLIYEQESMDFAKRQILGIKLAMEARSLLDMRSATLGTYINNSSK